MGKLFGAFSNKKRVPEWDDADSIMVIGMGRFGTSVATSLVQLGHQVLAVDSSAERVQNLADELPHVVQANTCDPEVLKQLSVLDFAHVVVSIGNDMESSVLTTLNLSQMGAHDIWVKANSSPHGRIVARLGAHHVIYPERDMGERVAHLVTGKMIDFIEFVDGFAIAKTRTPQELHHQTLASAGVRTRFDITVIGVKRHEQNFIYAQPETQLLPGDLLVVAGTTRQVEAFAAQTGTPLPTETVSEASTLVQDTHEDGTAS
ncbi:MAG: TrkA family potassium uptake protein [Brachymonas sp.]|nr:TrkA family potassium uptake protein [Brachymonas sp.]